MEKAVFLDIGCVAFDDIGMPLTSNRHIVFRYTGYKTSYVSKNKVMTEEDIAKKYLYSGRGVYYNRKIYFLSSDKEGNSLKRYKAAHDKKLHEIQKNNELNKQYLDGLLYENLFNSLHFDIARTIILFYENGIFDKKTTISKLKSYINFETINKIMCKLNTITKKEVG